MGVVTATINGTDITPYLRGGTLEIDHYLNQRPVCRFELNERIASIMTFRPGINKSIVITDGGTRVFGGVTYNITESKVVDNKGRKFRVDGVGYELYADKGLINGIVPAGTLKSQMTAVVANIGHGVSVDPAQVDGPALPAQGFPFATCRAALDQLSVASGYVYRFDHFGKVLMFTPGTIGAPFALVDTNKSILKLDVLYSLQDYINSVWVQFGSTQQQQVTVTLHGDGSTRLFPLGYNVATPPTTLTVNGTTYPVGIYGVDSTPAFVYFYRQDDPFFPYSIIQDVTAPAPMPLSPSDTMVVTFTGQFPGAVQVNNTVEIGTNGAFAIVIKAPDVYDKDVAALIGQGELDRRDAIITKITATTITPGLEPGMTVNVTASDYAVGGINYLITAVKLRHLITQRNGSQLFQYEINGVEGNRYSPWASWAQYFRNLSTSSAGSAGATVSGSGGSTSTPITIVRSFWGGSRSQGVSASGTWKDVRDVVPVRITGNSQPVTVRVFQATSNAGTSVQARIAKVGGSSMGTTATTTNVRNTVDSSNFVDSFLTFTPDPGVNDYVLQVQGGGADAVFAMGVSV